METVPMDVDSPNTGTAAPANPAAESSRDPESAEEKDRVICALSESRSSDVIGVAVINVTLGHVDLLRVVNDDRFRRLTETLWRMSTPPQTFLVLQKPCSQHHRSALNSSLKEGFPDAEVIHLDREHWNESEGLRLIDRFAWKQDIQALRQNLENNFYVSCAFAAVCIPFRLLDCRRPTC
jgi:DNA mismatch repair protein MSH4